MFFLFYVSMLIKGIKHIIQGHYCNGICKKQWSINMVARRHNKINMFGCFRNNSKPAISSTSVLSPRVVLFNPCLGNYILSCARQWSHLNYQLQLIPVPCHFFGYTIVLLYKNTTNNPNWQL